MTERRIGSWYFGWNIVGAATLLTLLSVGLRLVLLLVLVVLAAAGLLELVAAEDRARLRRLRRRRLQPRLGADVVPVRVHDDEVEARRETVLARVRALREIEILEGRVGSVVLPEPENRCSGRLPEEDPLALHRRGEGAEKNGWAVS